MSRHISSPLIALALLFSQTQAHALFSSLDEIPGLEERLCGQPSIEDAESPENSFHLSSEDLTWTILLDSSSFEELQIFLEMASLPFVCVPLDPDVEISPEVPIVADWFVYWSGAGSGISVSNQRGKPEINPRTGPIFNPRTGPIFNPRTDPIIKKPSLNSGIRPLINPVVRTEAKIR